MIEYPHVVDEFSTVIEVCAGASIGRYGDGELKLMLGRDCVSQRADRRLQAELQDLLDAKSTTALMGIPTLNKESPKFANWHHLSSRFSPFLRAGRTYHSSFISRPDSAPWTNTEKYFDMVQSLWSGKDVIFVGNNVRSLKKEFLEETGAKSVDWVPCPYRDAYATIGHLEKRVMELSAKVVILCVGATATCLAERLAKQGKHAIDLGHIGMFWRRYSEIPTWKEQREINKETGLVEKNP